MKRKILVFLTAGLLASACGGDDGIKSLGLGPDLNTSAPQVVSESQFTTTATGLKMHDFVQGTGDAVTIRDLATVHYTGWLTDGTKFDSSVDRGSPFAFILGVGGVIRGWDEGVLGMRAGGKRQLVIPPSLGYGPSGTGSIPPNATLVFEIELLKIGR